MNELETCVGRVPIAGIEPMTTIDFPGHIAGVLFTSGCPFNCRYCHNAGLRDDAIHRILSPEDLDTFLADRIGFLDGIVISGGEPTAHPGLPTLLKHIRNFGYATAIHTNGFYPNALKNILISGLVDYIAMDIKATPALYDHVTGATTTCVPIAWSIDSIISSGVDYEFRTTWHPDILSEEQLLDTVRSVANVGAKRYYLQAFREHGVTDRGLLGRATAVTIPEYIVKEGRRLFPEFDVR